MPRKATKSGPAPDARSSSKRPAPDAPTRQSKRARATSRKSYVEPQSDADEAADSDTGISPPGKHENDDDDIASDYKDQSDEDPLSESEHNETVSEEETTPKKATPRGRPTKRSSLPIHKKHTGEEELWKPGAKLAPGTRLVIKKPKARDAGDTPYADDTVHPNTMIFLQELAENNERQWLKCKCTIAFQSRSLSSVRAHDV